MRAWSDHVIHEARTGLRRDSFADDIARAFDELVRTLGVDKFLTRMGDAIGRSQARYVKRVAKVSIAQVASATDLESFRQANLALIRSLGADQVQKIADILRPAQAEGRRWEDVADEVQTRLNVGNARARLIARDQTNKWNGQMQRQSQAQAGITRYRWSTTKSMAVRGRPGGVNAKSKTKHYQLEGTIHAWDDPPVTNPSTGGRAHPGEDIQCECVAIPVVPWLE
jgi:SPP1 gp7 family putative phage head morphogenesis protein